MEEERAAVAGAVQTGCSVLCLLLLLLLLLCPL